MQMTTELVKVKWMALLSVYGRSRIRISVNWNLS